MKAHHLPRKSTLVCAFMLVLAGVTQAAAQFLPMPGQKAPAGQFPPANPFPPPPGSSQASQARQDPAFPPVPGAQNVCATFPAIRTEAEKGALAIRTASERKAAREQICSLFKSFVVKEARVVKFLEANQRTCGVPLQAIKVAKTNHAKTLQIRNQVCNAGPAGPATPTLSDALGGPIIADEADAKKPGRGTFDTLTGNVLAR
jgi:hypothetical protein